MGEGAQTDHMGIVYRSQRGEGKHRITHRISESQDWALGLWPVCLG